MERNMMWDHIYDEPTALQQLLESDQIDRWIEEYDVVNMKKVIVLASGSSLNVAITAKRFFEELAQVEVRTYTPFEFASANTIVKTFEKDTTLVIAISQTGTSSGTVDAIHHAKSLGLKVLSMTERTDTPVQQSGDYYLNFLSGEEPCNAKTKGVVNSLTLIILLAIHVAKEKSMITNELFNQYVEELSAAIYDLPETIEVTKTWVKHNQQWSRVPHFLVIGNGTNYGTAMEGTLKILETLCVPGVVSELGEFSHGIHRTINKDSSVIIIHTEEYGHEIAAKTIDYLKETVGNLLVINATRDAVLNNSSYINVKHRPLTASCLTINVVFQVLATALPELNGEDPNRPMNDELTSIVKTRY